MVKYFRNEHLKFSPFQRDTVSSKQSHEISMEVYTSQCDIFFGFGVKEMKLVIIITRLPRHLWLCNYKVIIIIIRTGYHISL